MITEQELLFEENPVPLFYMDNNQTIVEVNQAFSNRYIQSSSIVGRSLDGLFIPAPPDLLPDQPDSEYRYLNLPDGNSLLVELHINELFHQDKNVQLVAVKELLPSIQPIDKMEHPILETMFDNAFDIILITDSEGQLVHANDTACRKLGYSRSELLDMHLTEITHQAMQSYGLRRWDEFVDTGIDEGTYLLQTKQGEVLHTEYRAITNIRPGQHLSILRDITTQKKIEEREWLKSEVIESSADGIVFLSSDNKITYVNTSWLRLWGYDTKEEVSGRDIMDFVEQQPSRLALFDRKMQKEGSYRGQLTAIRKDGENFKVMVSASLVANTLGISSYRMATFEDITNRLQMKADLVNSRQRYQKLLESVPDAMIITDSEGKITFYNRAVSTILGYDRNELIGQPMELLLPEEHQSNYYKNINGYFEKPEKYPVSTDLDLYAVHKDGTKLPVDIMLGHLEDKDELHALAIMRDITKFKEARHKLEREKEFTDLLHRLTKISNEAKGVREALQRNIEEICTFMDWPVGHVYLPAHDGTSTFIPSDIWHIRQLDKFKTFVEITRRTGISPGEGIVGEVLQTRQSTWKTSINEDPNFIRARQKNNLSIQTAFAFPILVEKEIVGILEFFSPEDVSRDTLLLKKMSVISTQLGRVIERDRRQTLVKHNLELFSQLFENSPVGVVMLDESGRVKDVNPSFKKMFGYTLDEIINKKKIDFLMPEDWTGELHAISEYASRREPFQFESVRVNKKGEEIPVLVGIVPVRVEGKSIAVFVLYVDITERKRAEQQLQKSLQEKEVLLAEIHHRVKNNLAVIMGLLELQKDKTPDPKAKRSLQDSQSRIHSMALVHEQLYQTELFSSVQVNKYIKKLTDTIDSTFSDPEKEIELHIEAEPIELTMNQAVPLGLLLNEILTNAYKHAFDNRKRGRITITARETEGIVELQVNDNGHGLPDNFSLDKAESLGMNLIQILSVQIKADLDISGKNGTTFTIRFPRDRSL